MYFLLHNGQNVRNLAIGLDWKQVSLAPGLFVQSHVVVACAATQHILYLLKFKQHRNLNFGNDQEVDIQNQ